MSTKANEMPLSSLVPGGIGGLGKGGADTHMVEAHLAVQGAIRSVHCGLYLVFSFQWSFGFKEYNLLMLVLKISVTQFNLIL